MKVLFLDVDGVLNSEAWFAVMPDVGMISVDPKAVARVLRVVRKTSAAIVLSSMWRTSPGAVRYLTQQGLVIHDTTPLSFYRPRRHEIQQWLDAHPEVTAYAIIDDDPDAEIPGHFVLTSWERGMTTTHEKALREILGAK